MSPVAATFLFVVAILHTFCVGKFASLSRRAVPGSLRSKIFHLLSEVELVFALWAIVLIVFTVLTGGARDAFDYLVSRNYTEPLFVFVIMTVCATKPILDLVEQVLGRSKSDLVSFLVIMIAGPLLGSLITEPAAMTVCALLLVKRFYLRTSNLNFKYAMTGLLFVNISIGGTLTSFAAPPVLMVAGAWSWDSRFMFLNFGWKAVIAVVVSTALVAFRYRREIASMTPLDGSVANENIKKVKNTSMDLEPVSSTAPWWLTLIHIVFVAAIVVAAHQPTVFLPLGLAFIAIVAATKTYQTKLKFKDGVLVGLFLAGLVVLGGLQGWWLEPLLARLTDLPLFAGAALLTAVTDNAALTYLGSLVPTLSDSSKYALVAGAVTGGGLTVIANAPNPAGYGILSAARVFSEDVSPADFDGSPDVADEKSSDSVMSPVRLLLGALVPTIVAGICYWCL